jgi:hypothetical protein
MTGLHVNNFVTEDPRELIGAPDPLYKTRVDIDGPAGDRKCVELRILDHEKTVIKGLGTRDRENPSTDSIDIAFHF